jgi:hypothetical protein
MTTSLAEAPTIPVGAVETKLAGLYKQSADFQ